ncbi:hypothetical protein IW261DRAFT_1414600 [Armillaria novae-zelandiae]|uniref:DUF6535 domain-containing protein n=1 Tax=Armillaria novae-zelandiae TaxID=153914 RepID=A0AA39PSG8_9AGAR|nr:hypothetical protein IW261DRAFT_1414600 [Armillaria novae-zelandiae]
MNWGREKATDKQELGAQPGEREQKQYDVRVPGPDAASAASAKKILGTVKRPNSTGKKGNDRYNYEEKYPEDATYEETAPNARVWKTYEDESRSHDANIVEESRDNVDVLLVFAGLFSAVVTTIVAQTYQSLQADYAAMSTSLLFELILVQRAIANGSSVDTISASPLNPRIRLCSYYHGCLVALPSGTPRDRSFTRQFRYAGFQKWHVQVIIGLLPVLMHLALAIFLVGLVLFLRPLRAALSWIICVATVLVYAAYVIATILPILFPQCPYRTPLCDIVYVTFCRIIPRVSWEKDHFFRAWRIGFFRDMIHSLPQCANEGYNVASNDGVRVCAAISNKPSGGSIALGSSWSLRIPPVQSLVIQSVGGLPMTSNEMLFKLETTILPMRAVHRSLLNSCLRPDEKHPDCDKPAPGMELKVEPSQKGLEHDFTSPLVLEFKDALVLSSWKNLRQRPQHALPVCQTAAFEPASIASTIEVRLSGSVARLILSTEATTVTPAIEGILTASWYFSDGCDIACNALADLLASRVPIAYAVFLEHRCLEFFGDHVFRSAVWVPVIKKDDGGFFSRQFVWRPLHGEFHPLTATEIQVEKDNIRYVLSILDVLFNGGVFRDDSRPSIGPINRFLGWCIGQELEDKPERQQV